MTALRDFFDVLGKAGKVLWVIYLAVVVAVLACVLTGLLRVSCAEGATVTLKWSAPSDNVGVTAYAMHYSTIAPGADTTAWWSAATDVPGLPVPGPLGQSDSVQVTVGPGSYWFNVISRDAAVNWSSWSNWLQVSIPQPPDTTPPAPIRDLRIIIWPNPTPDGRFLRESGGE